MASKKRKEPYKPVGASYTLCKGANCDGAPLPKTRYESPEDFSYTTTSHHPPHKAAARIKRKCIYDEKKKTFTGERCVQEEKGKCIAKIRDTYCKPKKENPCASDRKSCPVQLIFIEGTPNLRFCRKRDKPGFIVPVASPEKAQQLAEEACADWGKWPDTFFNRKAPQLVKAAKKAHPKSPWGPGLGQPPAAPEDLPEVPGMPPPPPARAAMGPMVPLVGGLVALILAFSKK
jgi:hypothetical protein